MTSSSAASDSHLHMPGVCLCVCIHDSAETERKKDGDVAMGVLRVAIGFG